MNSFDVIIIGSGAGGSTLAHRLASTGKKILVIERGDFVPREKLNWSSKAVFLEGRYTAAESWLTGDGATFHPGTHYNVGGNTKFYGAALLRMRESDFGEVQHRGGISPAWPISYTDMRPYYLEAERMYFVHGQRGEDPTEPPESEPYAYPAIAHEPRIQKLSEDWAKLGHHPFHLPVAVMLDEANRSESRCIKCESCDGYPCLLHAKADAEVVAMRPALASDNVTLFTNTFVTKLETNPAGTAIAAVHVTRDGAPETYSAGIVVVSCGAINSAALLLRSADDNHPNGLANGSGVVGRHYMCHNNSTLLAISRTPNETVFQKTIALNDFYHRSDDWPYPLGHISMVGKTDADILREGAPRFAPHLALQELARHSIDFWLTTEDLPDPENRVTVEPNGQIRVSYEPNNVEAHERLIAKLKSMLHELGMEDRLMRNDLYLGKKIPIAGVAHQCGTVRFGSDPESSALDLDCRSHEIENLYVVDGSFFPCSSAVNPALTIYANALRVGDRLKQRI
ncbi:MAG TPA: GMC family oxidoreductase [Fimbriimonadaceae bacterium]|nr:GMC family oxidoreductase [Fimbriimonadaceae bacterium]